MFIVLLVSLLAGAALAEISMRVFGGQWFRSQIRQVGTNLQEFHVAIGDDARQAAVMRAGVMTLRFSLSVLVVLVVLAVIALIAPWMLEWDKSQQTVYLVAVSVAAMGWWLVRRTNRNAEATDVSHTYGRLDRWLHWLALEPAAVRHLAFDLERQFALPRCEDPLVASPADGAVYVCGLARSGTTMLLRILDECDDFRSLNYRDMPFVLAPNLWARFSRHARKESVTAERAHGDGILVNVDSPEGLEEVFWRTFGAQTSNPACFGFDEPDADVLANFADYRALVANPRSESVRAKWRRYLSKNNNNLLRLTSLCADPTATVLLAYRNPVATARSLHRQHQRFCASQVGDDFTRAYMGWLSHYEFGLDHRPFCFAVSGMDASLTPDQLDYWLDYWDAVYRYVLSHAELRFFLVNHDALRATPAATLAGIFKVLGVEADSAVLAQQIAGPDTVINEGFDPELLRRAEATYRELLNSSKNIVVRPE